MSEPLDEVDEFLWCWRCALRVRNPRRSRCPKCNETLDRVPSNKKDAPVLYHDRQTSIWTGQVVLDKFLR